MIAAPLNGTAAVVTGAAGQLGRGFVAALRGAGAAVVGLDLVAGPETDVVVDVTDRDSVDAARAEVERRVGPASVLITAAGIDRPPSEAGRTTTVEAITLEEFRATVDVNLTGTFACIQSFGAAMAAGGGGSIITIGSLYATVAPEPRFYDHLDVDPPFLKPPAYAGSKAGVLGITRYFARLWGPAGVRVNALSPGGVQAGQDPTFVAKYTARVPLGRMATLEDLTGPVLFLASDASRYVTGQELRVDGGFTA